MLVVSGGGLGIASDVLVIGATEVDTLVDGIGGEAGAEVDGVGDELSGVAVEVGEGIGKEEFDGRGQDPCLLIRSAESRFLICVTSQSNAKVYS